MTTTPLLPSPRNPKAAVSVFDSGELCYPGVKLSATRLELPANLPFPVWQRIVGTIYQNLEQYRWAIGDALNFGYHKWGEMYSQAEDETKMDYHRLADYKWVASRVPFSARNENLSWSHHRLVTKYPEESQVALLSFAEIQGLGVAQFKKHLDAMEGKEEQDEDNQQATTDPPTTDPLTDPLTAEEEAERAGPSDVDFEDIGFAGGGKPRPEDLIDIQETEIYRSICRLLLLHYSEEEKAQLLASIRYRLRIPNLAGTRQHTAVPGCPCAVCGRPLP